MIIVTAATAIYGAVEKSSQEKEAAKSRQDAIRTKMTEERAASYQRSINETNQVNRLMARQEAVGAANGSIGSPSFGAIQEDTLNQYANVENANNLNLTFQQEADLQNIQNQKSVNSAANAEAISSSASAVSTAASLLAQE